MLGQWDICAKMHAVTCLDEHVKTVSLFFSFCAGDEIYQDIFRDFSQMASNNPEKLNRFQQSDSQKSWMSHQEKN